MSSVDSNFKAGIMIFTVRRRAFTAPAAAAALSAAGAEAARRRSSPPSPPLVPPSAFSPTLSFTTLFSYFLPSFPGLTLVILPLSCLSFPLSHFFSPPLSPKSLLSFFSYSPFSVLSFSSPCSIFLIFSFSPNHHVFYSLHSLFPSLIIIIPHSFSSCF